ncbi:WD40-repeat-containing domain protein [Cerioporus squamosus]|nr:WD40-repeat-containing domain protein [Cerioporus squamosus]
MSTRSAKPNKKARISAESPKTSTLKKAALASKAKATASDAPTLSAKAKGKERAATPVLNLKKKKKTITAVSDPSSSTSLPTSFKVIAGSYEKLLYGLEGTVSVSSSSSEYSFDLRPIFIFPAHVSCIKSVAASPQGGKWLATGSADEIIKVWDLRRRKEIGGLMQHQGSITHLEFPSRSYMLSASEDGTLCRVNSVAVHQSCKVALSVGKDRTLRMWDLMRGKGSASTKIYKEGELVRWSADGSLFAVQAHATIDIYSTDMEHLHTITHPSRLHDIKFCKREVGSGELLLAGAEDKKLTAYDIPADRTKPPTVVAEMVGHTNRVKAVDTIRIALPAGAARSETTVVCTISSDGKVRLFDLSALPAPSSETQEQEQEKERLQLEPVAEYDTKGTRLTCVTLADGDVGAAAAAAAKRKREDEDDEEDDELYSPQEDGDGDESDGSSEASGDEE